MFTVRVTINRLGESDISFVFSCSNIENMDLISAENVSTVPEKNVRIKT